ncbi:MAG: sortase [Acutalibacteraceae bacterium]|nr:sortase [Acutalibacteraceae bacterium]
MKRKIAIVFMTLGILFIGFAMGLLIYNNYESRKAQESSDVLVESIRLSIAENELTEEITDPFDEEMVIKEIDGYGYIGYLSIPALQLDLPVMSEWDYGRLKISPCRYYGSTKTDNLVIAAHNYRFHFGYLGHLKPGDTVVFTDMESEKHIYHVTSVEQLMPDDVDKVKDSGDDLILYTCTYGGAKRITVRCNFKLD